MLDTPSGQRAARREMQELQGRAVEQLPDQPGRTIIIRFLRVGTLDDPGLMPPDVHIYTVSK